MKTGTLSINTAAIEKELTAYFYQFIEKFCDTAIEYFRSEIPMSANGAPGKPGWRDDLRDAIKTLSVEAANGVIRGEVGTDYLAGSREYIIAMIVDQGQTPPVMTRPGEITWDGDMYPHRSNAKTSYHIPQFEQEGINFIERARKRIKQRFDVEIS